MRAMMNDKACVSDITFDEWLGGELNDRESDSISSHLETCVRCRLRQEDIARSRSAFMTRVPSFAALSYSLGRAQKRERAPRSSAYAIGGGLAAAAAVALWLRGGTASEPTHRSKGGPSLGVYVKRDREVSRAQPGERVSAGDQLRFVYSSDRDTYFALFNLDDDKAETYYPLGARAERVPRGRDVALDFSIVLDDTQGSERLVGLFCEEPIAIEPVRAALATHRALPRLAACKSQTFELIKSPAVR